MDKIKIVWLCHFSNKNVRKRLPIKNMKFWNYIQVLLGHQPLKTNDFAPWVSNLILEFEKFENIELHIVAPHLLLKKKTEFSLNGIHYHFFPSDYIYPWNVFYNKLFPNQKNKFKRNRKFIKNFILKINPDLVNLIGSESPYYSIGVLDIKNIPIFVSCQTIYTNPKRKLLETISPIRWNVELKIHKKVLYYGCSGRLHRDLIIRNNPNAHIFKMFFPITKPPVIEKCDKEYDFALWGRITKSKGIEDAIKALAIVKRAYPMVTMHIIGGCEISYREQLIKGIDSLGLSKNIDLIGFFPIHMDMFKHVSKARYAVLPNKLDIISSTLFEAALLKIPTVTYKTTGSPFLNKDKESVLLASIGDINELANQMIKLLANEKLSKDLTENAYNFVEKEFNNETSAKRLLYDYYAIIDHYKYGALIPEKLLFNLKEFPIYK